MVPRVKLPTFTLEMLPVRCRYVNMYKAMKIYKEVGFDGVFIDDHVPEMTGDTSFAHRGRAYAAGYIKALLDVVNGEI